MDIPTKCRWMQQRGVDAHSLYLFQPTIASLQEQSSLGKHFPLQNTGVQVHTWSDRADYFVSDFVQYFWNGRYFFVLMLPALKDELVSKLCKRYVNQFFFIKFHKILIYLFLSIFSMSKSESAGDFEDVACHDLHISLRTCRCLLLTTTMFSGSFPSSKSFKTFLNLFLVVSGHLELYHTSQRKAKSFWSSGLNSGAEIMLSIITLRATIDALQSLRWMCKLPCFCSLLVVFTVRAFLKSPDSRKRT